MTTRRKIDIFAEREDRPFGLLSADDQYGLTFQYSHDADRNISLSLPHRNDGYRDVASRAFFGNLLPDNNLRDLVLQRHRLDLTDIAGLLQQCGTDCIGALFFASSGVSPGRLTGNLADDYEALSEADRASIMRLLRDTQFPFGSCPVSLLPGRQPKIALTMLPDGRLARPKAGSAAPTTHILKVPRQGEEVLLDLEFLSMRLAGQVLDGPVADVDIVDAEDMCGLLVERFDRVIEDGIVHRIHQEDFCQALGLPGLLKYERHGTEERCFNADAIGRLLSLMDQPSTARRHLLQATVFNLVMGNTDNHAKNHAILHSEGTIYLAPFYDIVPSVSKLGVTRELSFRVGDAREAGELRRGDIPALARALGLEVEGGDCTDEAESAAAVIISRTLNGLESFQNESNQFFVRMIENRAAHISEAIDYPITKRR